VLFRSMNCHSIVFLNIPCYASGKKPWKNGEEGYEPQSFSDGKLEVVGFQTADFMFLQMGGHGDHITQASKIRIVTDIPLPMQVDGEPVLLTQSEIIIEKKNQASMIAVVNEDGTTLAQCAMASFSCFGCQAETSSIDSD